MAFLVLAMVLTTIGQIPLSHHELWGLVPTGLGIGLLLIGLWRIQKPEATGLGVAPRGQEVSPAIAETPYRRALKKLLLPLAVLNAIIAFLGAPNNMYRWYGVAAWLLAIGLFLLVFWERDPEHSLIRRLGLGRRGWRLSWTALAIIGIVVIGAWFRFWRLGDMPHEMTSDHIEKLLDVHDLVVGKRPIFFVRNTGREPWQFYWTLLLIRLFGLDVKFFALKLGTAIIGVITLPGVYLLGRELFGRWVGLWATLFVAVASWPVILSRIGLRFPFAPAATAWSLLYLLRGLRDGRRNDFLMLGLWLGIGLQGYTAFRAMPLAVIVCWGIALITRPSALSIQPRAFLRNASLAVLVATIVFIPLGRFSLENPGDFWRRSFSRMADPEQPMPEGPVITLAKNAWSLALMFHWQGDDVWVNTLAKAPVLDPVLGALLLLGLVIVWWRGVRWHDPTAPLLLIAGLVLLLPSALSLAYPIENPSVVRTGGAIPAVMVIAALPIGLTLQQGTRSSQEGHHLRPSGFRRSGQTVAMVWKRTLLFIGATVLAASVIGINYRRYFVDYWDQFENNALNTTEIASAIRGFVESGGDKDNAWIVAWPYWIDTRGVGIELGDPPWNNVILETEELIEQAVPSSTSTSTDGRTAKDRPRFYVLHPADTETLVLLRSLFPAGWSSIYDSDRPGRDFILFYVPRTSSQRSIDPRKGGLAYAS